MAQRARALSARASRSEGRLRLEQRPGTAALTREDQVLEKRICMPPEKRIFMPPEKRIPMPPDTRIPMPPLFGMLLKQHAHSTMFSWGRRYVNVDDRRGVLWYAKGAHAQPSAILPLCDVLVLIHGQPDGSAPDLMPQTEGGLEFVVSCPPMRLTFRAADPTDLAVWVSSIRECARAWKIRTDNEQRRL